MQRRTPVILSTAAVLLIGSGGASLAADAGTEDAGESARAPRLEASAADGTSEGAISESAFRVAGEDRYATSAEVSFLQWEPGEVTEVFLASGESFPDALSMAASTRDTGPLLLTRRDQLPAPVADELARLAPCLVIVVGGPSQVSDAVALEADSYTDPAACG